MVGLHRPKGISYYVGITTDPHNRLKQHGSPASVYLEGPTTREEAVNQERRLKGLTSEKKRDLLKKSSQQE
jgi:predicted GIY-YIG superfamily endonuclease